jgi:uncharacterized protein YcbX
LSPSTLNVENQCKISFSNESQFLIISEASVADINSRVGDSQKKINSPTFRPNLVIKGGHAYQEDEWQEINIGNQGFKVSYSYGWILIFRCLVHAIDAK